MNKNFKMEDWKRVWYCNPKIQDNPTGDEDRVNPIPPKFLPFKDFAIPWRDLFIWIIIEF